ncbi:MAG: dihydrofolate reductase family protein [Chloroflexota bacterium]
MAKLVVSEFLTLDGVMQGPGDPNEDRSGGFDRGGWQLAYFDDIFGGVLMEGFAATGGYLLGRRTYEIFAAHWPNQPADDPLAATFNDSPKYVVSTTLREPLPWQNSIVIGDDVRGRIEQLKAEPGKDVQVIGSGQLVRMLTREGLVDEYRFLIHPLVLGAGKRLFEETDAPVRLRLVDTKPTSTGVLIVSYVPERAASDQAARSPQG